MALDPGRGLAGRRYSRLMVIRVNRRAVPGRLRSRHESGAGRRLVAGWSPRCATPARRSGATSPRPMTCGICCAVRTSGPRCTTTSCSQAARSSTWATARRAVPARVPALRWPGWAPSRTCSPTRCRFLAGAPFTAIALRDRAGQDSARRGGAAALLLHRRQPSGSSPVTWCSPDARANSRRPPVVLPTASADRDGGRVSRPGRQSQARPLSPTAASGPSARDRIAGRRASGPA